MLLPVLIVLLGIEYPMLNTLTLKEPTEEQRQEVEDLLNEYQVKSLVFDRFAALGKGSIASVFGNGKGTEFKEFRCVFATDHKSKMRRLLHESVVRFREDLSNKQHHPNTSFGAQLADCLIKSGVKERMWLEYGGHRADGWLRNSKEGKMHFDSVFRFRIVSNPFCMAQYSYPSHQGGRCHKVYVRGFSKERIRGFLKKGSSMYVHWFHAVRGTNPPHGCNSYLAFEDGLPVVVEEWVGMNHLTPELAGDPSKHGYLQARTMTTWGKLNGNDIPKVIEAHDGEKTKEVSVEFEWLVDKRVPTQMFETRSVGKTRLGDVFAAARN